MKIEPIKSPEYKIRKIREIKNYSQDYIAQNLGLSVRAYSKIETGETQLTIKRLNQISQILQVAPILILGFDEKLIFSGKGLGSKIMNGLMQVSESPVEYFDAKLKELENDLNYLRQTLQKTLNSR